jgi:hypothetical protein
MIEEGLHTAVFLFLALLLVRCGHLVVAYPPHLVVNSKISPLAKTKPPAQS